MKMVTRGMGEGESIVQYPRLIDVFVAAGSDSTAKEASRSELKAVIRGLTRWRPELRFHEGELRRLQQPVLLIWVTTTRSVISMPLIEPRKRSPMPGSTCSPQVTLLGGGSHARQRHPSRRCSRTDGASKRATASQAPPRIGVQRSCSPHDGTKADGLDESR